MNWYNRMLYAQYHSPVGVWAVVVRPESGRWYLQTRPISQENPSFNNIFSDLIDDIIAMGQYDENSRKITFEYNNLYPLPLDPTKEDNRMIQEKKKRLERKIVEILKSQFIRGFAIEWKK